VVAESVTNNPNEMGGQSETHGTIWRLQLEDARFYTPVFEMAKMVRTWTDSSWCTRLHGRERDRRSFESFFEIVSRGENYQIADTLSAGAE
jgi:hypothetical protein